MSKGSKKTESKRTVKENILDWIVTIAMGVALYFAIDFCIGRVRVDGISMDTTFHEGQLLMVNKLNYRFNEPKRGDVVVFTSPVEPDKEYIKRLIGLPGDKISVQDAVLYLNGNAVDEPYLHEAMTYDFPEMTVPEGMYFAMGDNRNHSFDSHNWGGVPRENLIGNAFFRYWPLTRIGIISNDTPLASVSDGE